jgi:hypothetical protein
MAIVVGDGGGNRRCVDAAVVLVARERVERDFRDGCGICRVGVAAAYGVCGEQDRWFAMIASKARNRSSMMAAKVSAFSKIASPFNGKLGVMVAV